MCGASIYIIQANKNCLMSKERKVLPAYFSQLETHIYRLPCPHMEQYLVVMGAGRSPIQGAMQI